MIMNEAQRLSLSKATQAARTLLETEFREQLEGTFDIRSDGTIPEQGPASLTPFQRHARLEILSALENEHEGPDPCGVRTPITSWAELSSHCG